MEHVPELDGLRGIAILSVLITHLFSYSMGGRPWTGLGKVVYQATIPGWLGVDLFFVLSGFLITRILLRSKSQPHFFRNFYARRALRILPLYLLLLALLWLFYDNSSRFVLLGLLMSTNLAAIFQIPVVHGGQALWSLAVEEHFYLLWPGVVRLVRPSAFIIVPALICILEPLVRAAFRNAVEDVYFYSWFRFDGLAWGSLVAAFVHKYGADRKTSLRIAAISGTLLVGLLALGLPFGILHRGNLVGAALQFTLFYILFANILLLSIAWSGTPYSAPLRFRPLTLSGDLSYCMYLVHMPLMDLQDLLLARLVDLESSMSNLSFVSLRALGVVVLCFGVAALSRRFIEQPILSFKRHFSATA